MRRARRTGRKIRNIIVVLIAVIIAAAGYFGLDESDLSSYRTDAVSESASDTASDSSEESSSSDTESASESSEITGDFYSIVGEAEADMSVSQGETSYSDLDSLGRAGKASACVTYDMMITALNTERESMSDLYPSGWTDNAEVTITFEDGTIYNGWFWNV